MVSRRTTERIQGLMTAYQQSGIWAPHNPGQSGKASPADARRTNRSLIFSLLFPDVQLSRAELGRRTGLSRVAVSDVVNSMLSCHLLRENGRESNGGKGKRGTLLSVDPDTLHIISIDLSQPHLIQGEATNLLGEPVMHVEHALRAVNHVDFDTINEVITPLHAATQNVIGIGLAMPGVVDGNGLVKRSTLLGWRNVDVRTPIERRFSLPVTVNNDATAAMFTERLFGKGGPNMMFVRLRRGVGGAVLLGDVPVFGENHAGGEIGHITVNRHETAACGCGKHGCLEQYSSATGVVRCMKKLLDENPDADCVLRGKDFEAKDVFDAARSGDALAAREVDEMTDTLGMALATIASTTDPEMFLIGGGVSRAGDVLFDPLVEHFKTYAFKSCRETPIKAASLGNDAGIYGAVRLIVGE